MFQKIATSINEYGQIVLNTEQMIDMMLKQGVIDNVIISDDDEVEKYEKFSAKFYKEYKSIKKEIPIKASPTQYFNDLSSRWIIPKKYYDYDIVKILSSRCKSNTELERLVIELREFIKRDQVKIILAMFYLVDWLRENNIVWGVGRGSSVASFVLYLIGINRINPLDFDIDLSEFFK